MSDGKTNYAPVIIFGVLAVTTVVVVYLITRKPATTASNRRVTPPRTPVLETIPLSKVASYAGRAEQEKDSFTEDGLPVTFYKNKEKWHIEWSADGLPINIEVERNARRS